MKKNLKTLKKKSNSYKRNLASIKKYHNYKKNLKLKINFFATIEKKFFETI